MSPTFLGYIGFVVAALILIWAVIELGRRINEFRKADSLSVQNWTDLDPKHPDPPAESPLDLEDEEDADGQPLHIRARQNGHYSGSKKPH